MDALGKSSLPICVPFDWFTSTPLAGVRFPFSAPQYIPIQFNRWSPILFWNCSFWAGSLLKFFGGFTWITLVNFGSACRLGFLAPLQSIYRLSLCVALVDLGRWSVWGKCFSPTPVPLLNWFYLTLAKGLRFPSSFLRLNSMQFNFWVSLAFTALLMAGASSHSLTWVDLDARSTAVLSSGRVYSLSSVQEVPLFLFDEGDGANTVNSFLELPTAQPSFTAAKLNINVGVYGAAFGFSTSNSSRHEQRFEFRLCNDLDDLANAGQIKATNSPGKTRPQLRSTLSPFKILKLDVAAVAGAGVNITVANRSEERRVGKECV